MKLVDLKRPKEEAKKMAKGEPMDTAVDEYRYPWGSKLRFDKEEIDKIPVLKDVKAGAMVDIQAIGKITEVHVTDVDNGKERHTVEIQIQQIAIADKGTFSAAFKEAAEKD